jgi:hypothetical protein
MATLGYSIEHEFPQKNDVHPFWAQFDGIVFICASSNTRQNTDEFLKKHGIPAHIFTFLPYRHGIQNASRFHRHRIVLKFALKSGWKNAVVLEDNLELVGPYIAQSQYDAITSFAQSAEFGSLSDVLSLVDTYTNLGRKVQTGIHESTNKTRGWVYPYFETCPGAYIASQRFMQHFLAGESEPNSLHEHFVNSSRVRFVSPALFYQSMIEEQFKGPFIFKKLWYRKQRSTPIARRIFLNILLFVAFVFFFVFFVCQ